MAVSAGTLYEQHLIDRLAPFNYIPADKTSPAGSDDSIPDITIQNSKGQESGVEVKLAENPAFGSGTLAFDVTKHLSNMKPGRGMRGNADPWYIAEVDQYGGEIKEAQKMISEMAKAVKLVDKVNDKWYWNNKNYPKYSPWQIDQAASLYKRLGVQLPSKQIQYSDDQKYLDDIHIECPYSNIVNYYTKKKSYYIQIGNKGLYILGSNDPLGLRSKGVPSFSPTESNFRIRFQPKGSTGGPYRFAFELYCKGLTNSPISLGNALGSGASYRGVAPSDLSFLR